MLHSHAGDRVLRCWHLAHPSPMALPALPLVLHQSSPHLPARRAKLEQELQQYPQLSAEQRAAALAEHERREREYSRLQRQRLCMDDFEPLKLIGKVGVGGWDGGARQEH